MQKPGVGCGTRAWQQAGKGAQEADQRGQLLKSVCESVCVSFTVVRPALPSPLPSPQPHSQGNRKTNGASAAACEAATGGYLFGVSRGQPGLWTAVGCPSAGDRDPGIRLLGQLPGCLAAGAYALLGLEP